MAKERIAVPAEGDLKAFEKAIVRALKSLDLPICIDMNLFEVGSELKFVTGGPDYQYRAATEGGNLVLYRRVAPRQDVITAPLRYRRAFWVLVVDTLVGDAQELQELSNLLRSD
jgi:hypothetical protein